MKKNQKFKEQALRYIQSLPQQQRKYFVIDHNNQQVFDLCDLDRPPTSRASLLAWKEFQQRLQRQQNQIIFLIFQGKQIELKTSLSDPCIFANYLFQDHWNYLHFAANHPSPRLSIVSTLISFGVQINGQTKSKRTPLHFAVLNSNWPLVQLLIQNGADTSLKDQSGQSAADLLASFSPANKLKLKDLKFLKLINEGAFGKVYLCRVATWSQQLFAVKIINKKENPNFIYNQISILKSICFSFIARLKFSLQTDQSVLLGMHYFPGGSLAQLLSKNFGVIPEKWVRAYAAQLYLALRQLHKNDIIYRDLKPENVVLDCKGHAILVDFGISLTEFRDSEEKVDLAGTRYYQPLQYIQGRRVSRMIDWYSYGALIHTMITGKPPFYNPSYQQHIQLLKSEEFDPSSLDGTCSPELAEFLTKLLTKDFEKRLGQDEQAIGKERWFKDTDWQRVLQGDQKMPWIPKCAQFDQQGIQVQMKETQQENRFPLISFIDIQ